MMADQAETKYCSNCKRDIAVANFVMHEVHCRRNIILCKKCSEPVARSEVEAHHEEVHALEPCPLCDDSFERSHIDIHKEEQCPRKPMQCCYCELDVARCELEEHLGYCGTRTEPCTKCGQYIMHKDLTRHEESNCSYPSAKQTTGPSRPNNSQPSNFASDLNSFAMDEISRILDNDVRRGAPSSRLNIGPRTNLARSNRTATRHNNIGASSVEQRSRKNERRAARNSQQRDTSPPINVPQGDAMRASELDHLLAMHLAQDLGGSTEDSWSNIAPANNYSNGFENASSNDDWQPQPLAFYGDVDDANASNPRTDNFSNLRHNNNSPPPASHLPSSYVTAQYNNEDILVPCEFCGDSYPLDILMDHQDVCNGHFPSAGISNNNIPSPSSTSSQPQQDILNNAITSTNNTPAPVSNLVDNIGPLSSQNEVISGGVEWAEEEVCLPCEFCENPFPLDVLVQHQAVCDADMNRHNSPARQRRRTRMQNNPDLSPTDNRNQSFMTTTSRSQRRRVQPAPNPINVHPMAGSGPEGAAEAYAFTPNNDRPRVGASSERHAGRSVRLHPPKRAARSNPNSRIDELARPRSGRMMQENMSPVSPTTDNYYDNAVSERRRGSASRVQQTLDHLINHPTDPPTFSNNNAASALQFEKENKSRQNQRVKNNAISASLSSSKRYQAAPITSYETQDNNSRRPHVQPKSRGPNRAVVEPELNGRSALRVDRSRQASNGAAASGGATESTGRRYHASRRRKNTAQGERD